MERVQDGLPFALELGVSLCQDFLGVGLPLVQGAGHVLPDENAQLIAPVIEPGRLDLDVLAEHVHAQGFDRFQVVAQGGVRRSGVEAVGPPALVEGPELEERFVVQEKPEIALAVFAQGDFPHPGVARDFVQRLAVLLEDSLEVVKDGARGRPEFRLEDLQDRRLACGNLGFVDDGLAPSDGHGHGRPFGIPRDRRLNHERPSVHVRGCLQIRDISFRHGLEPDRLPDTGHCRIENAARPHDLLSPRDGAVLFVGRVVDAQNDLLLGSPLEGIGDVISERIVAAAVNAGLAVVDPDRALPVHGPEVKEDPPATPFLGNCDSPAIPEGFFRTDRLADPRERRLDGEGNEDLPVPGLRPAGVLGHDGIVPEPVEAEPLFAGHMRPRVFGKDQAGLDLGGPAGHDPALDGLPFRRRLRFARGDTPHNGDSHDDYCGEFFHGGTPIEALVIHPDRTCQ